MLKLKVHLYLCRKQDATKSDDSHGCGPEQSLSFEESLQYLLALSRSVAHAVARMVKAYSSVFDSSGTGSLWATRLSIYNSIASLAIRIASSTVSPYVIHPGKVGTEAVYPPSGSGLDKTLYVNCLIIIPFKV